MKLRRRAKDDPTRKAFETLGKAIDDFKTAVKTAAKEDANRLIAFFWRPFRKKR